MMGGKFRCIDCFSRTREVSVNTCCWWRWTYCSRTQNWLLSGGWHSLSYAVYDKILHLNCVQHGGSDSCSLRLNDSPRDLLRSRTRNIDAGVILAYVSLTLWPSRKISPAEFCSRFIFAYEDFARSYCRVRSCYPELYSRTLYPFPRRMYLRLYHLHIIVLIVSVRVCACACAS